MTPTEPTFMRTTSCADPASEVRQWCLYLLECKGGALYAWITNDLAARYKTHATGRGAKFTRAFPPRRIVDVCPFPDRSTASKAEAALKARPRRDKLATLRAMRAASTLPALGS
jgi:putative endonuclease